MHLLRVNCESGAEADRRRNRRGAKALWIWAGYTLNSDERRSMPTIFRELYLYKKEI